MPGPGLVEGGVYQSERFLRATTIAETIRYVVQAPPDAQFPEMVVRPAP